MQPYGCVSALSMLSAETQLLGCMSASCGMRRRLRRSVIQRERDERELAGSDWIRSGPPRFELLLLRRRRICGPAGARVHAPALLPLSLFHMMLSVCNAHLLGSRFVHLMGRMVELRGRAVQFAGRRPHLLALLLHLRAELPDALLARVPMARRRIALVALGRRLGRCRAGRQSEGRSHES